jgi:hypothetical protein
MHDANVVSSDDEGCYTCDYKGIIKRNELGKIGKLPKSSKLTPLDVCIICRDKYSFHGDDYIDPGYDSDDISGNRYCQCCDNPVCQLCRVFVRHDDQRHHPFCSFCWDNECPGVTTVCMEHYLEKKYAHNDPACVACKEYVDMRAINFKKQRYYTEATLCVECRPTKRTTVEKAIRKLLEKDSELAKRCPVKLSVLLSN